MTNVKVIMLANDQLGQVKVHEHERMVSMHSLCKIVLPPALLRLPTSRARVKIEFVPGSPS